MRQNHLIFSVVIPNYNGSKYLEETLDSIFAQSHQAHEVLVVDDGSTDNSLAILEEYKKLHANLKVIKQQNGGPSKARNLGVLHAQGNFIAFLDSDDLWHKDFLTKMALLIDNTQCHLAYANYLWFDQNKQYVNQKAKDNPMELFDLWSDSMLSPSGLVFEKASLLNIGGWDEELWACEDMDLWFRAKMANLQIASIQENLIYIRQHEANSKDNFFKMYDGHCKSLNKWLKITSQELKKTPSYRKAVRLKIQKIRYYAYLAKDNSKVWDSFYLGFKLLGFKYLDKVAIYQLYKFIIKNKQKR
jgi:glycosyltransferase involved in cell wall biosynthesis